MNSTNTHSPAAPGQASERSAAHALPPLSTLDPAASSLTPPAPDAAQTESAPAETNAPAHWLRPSALPKLALCGRYRPDPAPGAAAERGTRLDGLFRLLIAHHHIAAPAAAEDRQALSWAVETARILSGGLPLESREDALRIECLGLTGTADLLCAEARWSADLKTGQRHDYRAQQAAYALGFMDAFFCDAWTVHLLYCDLEHVETLRFTREEAEEIVRHAIAAALDETAPPQPNESCGWCARRWECPARREALGILPLGGPAAVRLEEAPSPLLREFVLRAGIVEDFAERARDLLKERLILGEKIPGCSLVSRRGSRRVPPAAIEQYWHALGAEDLLAAYGSLSEGKLRELWQRKLPDQPFPADAVEEQPGSTFLRLARPRELTS